MENTQEPIDAAQFPSAPKIIWTPVFLLIFALTSILGVSAESLFTEGWMNGLFTTQWILLGHVILVAVGWLSLGIITHSRWLRIGCIFGGIWAIFMSLSIFIYLHGLSRGTPLQSYLNTAICMALLGAYIGLSIEGTLLTAWDSWLFLLVPLLSIPVLAGAYLLTPQASILTVENTGATCALLACNLFWWARPSCWQKHPGPTFLFGLVPLLLLLVALSTMSMQDFFMLQIVIPRTNPLLNANSFFFIQITLLCLLLGCTRTIKSEKSH